MRNKRYRHVATLWLCAAATFPLIAHSAPSNAVPISLNRQLSSTLEHMQAAWNSRRPEAVATFYCRDAKVTGQGMAEVASGRPAIERLVASLMKGSGATSIAIFDARRLGPRSALSWVTWTVKPGDPKGKEFKIKSLFAWQRSAGAHGAWRICADMFSDGPMPGM